VLERSHESHVSRGGEGDTRNAYRGIYGPMRGEERTAERRGQLRGWCIGLSVSCSKSFLLLSSAGRAGLDRERQDRRGDDEVQGEASH
jgi:hypothetical protein